MPSPTSHTLKAAVVALHANPEPGTPAQVRDLLEELHDEMLDAGWPPAQGVPAAGPVPSSAPVAPPAPVPSPSPVPGAPSPQRLAVGPDPDVPGRVLVRAKEPGSERGARTIQQLLDAVAGYPISPLADVLLDFAIHVEALELENHTLRAQLAAAQQGGNPSA